MRLDNYFTIHTKSRSHRKEPARARDKSPPTCPRKVAAKFSCCQRARAKSLETKICTGTCPGPKSAQAMGMSPIVLFIFLPKY